MLLHTSHPHRITSTKCCVNTVLSPDDGHIVAQNVQRKYTKNKYAKNKLCTELDLFTKSFAVFIKVSGCRT